MEHLVGRHGACLCVPQSSEHFIRIITYSRNSPVSWIFLFYLHFVDEESETQ